MYLNLLKIIHTEIATKVQRGNVVKLLYIISRSFSKSLLLGNNQKQFPVWLMERNYLGKKYAPKIVSRLQGIRFPEISII
jgi:hypothetical protein